MKKILTALLLIPLFSFIFPISILADDADPTFTLTIVKETEGGNGSFNFDLVTYPWGIFLFDNFIKTAFAQTQLTYTINTTNSIGSITIPDLAAVSTFYDLREQQHDGWGLNDLNCVSDIPFIRYYTFYSDSDVEFVPASGSHVTCTFINYNLAPAKTPVLIVPGVLGTDIKKGEDLLWANPKMARGFDGFMDPLAFNSDLTPLDTSLTLGAVIRRKPFLDYTDGLINQLTSPETGYTEGQDLFTFPYDWRFGVSEDIVNQFKGQIDYIASTTGSSVVDVVAHSTGGLLVKKYVMEHPTDHHIGKAVFVGVPNLGAPKALKVLLVGDNFDVFNLDPDELKKISQNMPVVYDLAPSQEYYNQAGSFFHIHNPLADPANIDKDLDFTDAMQNLVDYNYISSQAVSDSKNLHTADFDNYDLTSEGVDLYNLVGCKTGTFGKFTEWINKSSAPTFDFPKVVSGDQTVPFVSADSLTVDENKTFFAPKIKHGDLLSADGSRQQIISLLIGTALNTNGKILTRSEVNSRPDLCEIKGESLKIKSPVSIDIVDENENHAGLMEDGSIENNIPGADYEVWGEHKYVFLPTDEGQQYTIKLAGTGSGTFTLDDESIVGDATTQTQVFSNLPVTPDLTGQVNLGSGSNQTTLTLQATPASAPVVVAPDSIINTDQSQDLTPPISTITGLIGEQEFYRSDVNIHLSAQDFIISGKENQTSGILKLNYQLDGGDWQQATSSDSNLSLTLSTLGEGINKVLLITAEGQHILTFYSTDRAGNNEPEQTINFTIDKTPPEFMIQFNPALQDLAFTATDTLPTTLATSSLASSIKPSKARPFPIPWVKIKDEGNIITATDAAGNITVLTLKDKDRKRQLKAEIKSLSYNGKLTDINKTWFHFDWLFDKKGILKLLTQNVQAKKDFNISAIYDGKKTRLLGRDQKNKINETKSGLVLLKVSTNQGDFNWSY
jgi:hypothetical protein